MSDTERDEWKHFEDLVPEEARAHMRAARDEMRKGFEAMFPPGVGEHRRAARREALLAARSMIDAMLKRFEEGEKKP
jgi:hypothetical protein